MIEMGIIAREKDRAPRYWPWIFALDLTVYYSVVRVLIRNALTVAFSSSTTSKSVYNLSLSPNISLILIFTHLQKSVQQSLSLDLRTRRRSTSIRTTGSIRSTFNVIVFMVCDENGKGLGARGTAVMGALCCLDWVWDFGCWQWEWVVNFILREAKGGSTGTVVCDGHFPSIFEVAGPSVAFTRYACQSKEECETLHLRKSGFCAQVSGQRR